MRRTAALQVIIVSLAVSSHAQFQPSSFQPSPASPFSGAPQFQPQPVRFQPQPQQFQRLQQTRTTQTQFQEEHPQSARTQPEFGSRPAVENRLHGQRLRRPHQPQQFDQTRVFASPVPQTPPGTVQTALQPQVPVPAPPPPPPPPSVPQQAVATPQIQVQTSPLSNQVFSGGPQQHVRTHPVKQFRQQFQQQPFQQPQVQLVQPVQQVQQHVGQQFFDQQQNSFQDPQQSFELRSNFEQPQQQPQQSFEHPRPQPAVTFTRSRPAPVVVRTQDADSQTSFIRRPTQQVREKDLSQFDEELFREQAENAKYTFSSAVSDTINDNEQVRQETRDGLNLKGLYSYSDGFFRRTVHYEADENGYRVVKEEVDAIGDGPQVDPDGRAEVQSNVGGSNLQYSVTKDDIPTSHFHEARPHPQTQTFIRQEEARPHQQSFRQQDESRQQQQFLRQQPSNLA